MRVAAALLALALGCEQRARPRDAGATVAAEDLPMPPEPVVELAVGWYSAMARLADGSIWTWGHWGGQAQARPVRVPLAGATGLAASASQAYFCAIGAGGARCLTRLPPIYGEGWGDSWALDFGASPPGGRLRQVAVGDDHACALTVDGAVWCWGRTGALGGGEARAGKPVSVGLDEVEQIGVGGRRACALRRDRTVWCWSGGPPRSVAVSGAVEIAVGEAQACARHENGTISCWPAGRAASRGPAADRAAVSAADRAAVSAADRAALLPGVRDAVQLAAGGHALCARRKDGRVLCWGHDQRSDTVGAANLRAPREVPGVDDARLIAAGPFAGCSVRASGAVACWGSRRFGQLGDGTDSGAALTHVRW